MTDTLKTYFDFAQFSMAAYANLPLGIPNLGALQGAGFSSLLADHFTTNYRVVSVPSIQQQEFGFFAQVFERWDVRNDRGTGEYTLAIRGTDDAADILIDAVSIGILGSENLNPQYAKLKEYVQSLTAENGLLFGKTFTVTGHSLGGFLAQALVADSEVSDSVSKVYTYNGPGFGGPVTDLLNALGISNPLVGSVPVGKVTNLVASNGLSPIAGLGQHIGETLPVFIEAGTPLNNHSITTLTDALAVYDLFGKLDAQAQVQPITDILNAMSAVPANSLEQAVVALQRLLDPTQPRTLPTGDQDALYNALQTLASHAQVNGSKVVISLVHESASDLQTMAQVDSTLGLAARYALRELNPFVIAGDPAVYLPHNQHGELNLFDASTGTGELTAEYVTDRAEFLAKKMEINRTDGGLLTGLTGLFNDVHFKDYQSGYDIPAGLFAQVVTTPREFLFGSVHSETLTGNSADDRLYGGDGHDALIGQDGADYFEGSAGNDTLTGGTGNDELWGGTGFDTYVWNTGDGHDRIEDSDASGVIIVNGKTLAGGVKKAGHTDWISADGTLKYVMSGTDLVVKLSGTPILTVNEDSESGQFGRADVRERIAA